MRTVALAVVVAAIAGCGRSPMPEGLVTAKKFEPAHTDVIYMPVTIGSGSSATTMMMPYFIHEPDRWVMTVEPYDAGGNPLKPVRVLVTQAVYDEVKLGGWFKATPESLDHRKARKEEKRD